MIKFLEDKVSLKWRAGAIISYLVMLFVNGLAGSTNLIGGVRTNEVSDINSNLFTPAGLTFSIWGVIYILLGVFIIWACFMKSSKLAKIKHDRATKTNLIQIFTVTSVLNAAWLLAWQYQVLWLSVIIMLALLYSLRYIWSLLNNYATNWREYVMVRLPFSVYFGWIIIATIANITAWLVNIKWDGMGVGPVEWTLVVLIIGAAIVIKKAISGFDPALLAVAFWAYLGILLNHTLSQNLNSKYPPIIAALVTLMIILSINLIWLLIKPARLINKK